MILIFLLFVLIFLALCLEAFFSGAETAFVSVNFLKLMHLIEKKNKRAIKVHDLLKKPDRLLATTLIGTNLAVVISSACAAALFSRVSVSLGALMTTLVMTPISFIFCQLLPKTVCRYWANRIVLYVAHPLTWSERFFLPFVNFFTHFANTIARMINPHGLKKNPFITKDEIKCLIKDISCEGILEPHEKDAIDKIFDMTLTKAMDIMVPLKKVVFFDKIEDVAAIKVKARGSVFTRFPVFDGVALKGMINIFDVLYGHCADWQGCLRPIVRVEHDESLDKVFAKMQPNQETLAAVYKGQDVVGILTMEDLMEQITARLTAVKK